MSSRYKNKSKHGVLGSALFCFAVGAVSFVIFSLISSFLLSLTKNPLANVGMASFVTLLLSGALSGICTARYKQEQTFLSVLLGSLFFCVIFLSAGLISGGGSIGSVVPINLSVFILVNLLFSVIGKRKHKRRR